MLSSQLKIKKQPADLEYEFGVNMNNQSHPAGHDQEVMVHFQIRAHARNVGSILKRGS